MRQGAQGWCTGMTLRDGMGREVGGGFRMGNTYTPMADPCQCMAKPIQYCKVKIIIIMKHSITKKKKVLLDMPEPFHSHNAHSSICITKMES